MRIQGRTTIVIMVAMILCVLCIVSAGAIAAEPARSLPENETLVYDIRWLGFAVGKATASITGIEKINGRDAYRLEITARTNDFCSKIYKVDDRYVSYLDTEKLCTLRHEVYRREGHYKKDAVTDFDQINGKAYFKNLLDGSKKTIDIEPGTQDPVSMAYYFRLVPVKEGDQKEFRVYNNESVYWLYGVIGKTQAISVPRLGKIDVFCVRPYAKLKEQLVRKGQARIYFDSDDRRVPVIGIANGPVFTEVIGYLKEGFYLPGKDFH